MKKASSLTLAQDAFYKHLEVHDNFDHYAGILTLQAYARLATKSGDAEMIAEVTKQLAPFIRGERSFFVNFPNYLCGGNATAWMLAQGHVPEAAETVRHYAEQILHEAPKDANGILTHPGHPGFDAIWIDVAFAVSPFLLYAGLALKEEAYVEEAFQQTAKMVRTFLVEETGLVIQSHNIRGRGTRSDDHWSRGNGWAALALTELALSLPEDHPRKAEAVELFVNHVNACAKFQDPYGLWHQEMTEPVYSYAETSGTGLMLYALGAGIEAGLIPESELPRFELGLKGMLSFISEDTDIYHTCMGCLCPGEGTKVEYMGRAAVLNDKHAFGPVVLAMGQAHLLGIDTIER